MESKKIVFIIGQMNVPNYWKPYEEAEDKLTAEGFIPLSPSRLPHDLPKEKMFDLQASMLSAADAVLLIPGWNLSSAAQILLGIAKAMNKPIARYDAESEGKE
jgi:hypothetical protein